MLLFESPLVSRVKMICRSRFVSEFICSQLRCVPRFRDKAISVPICGFGARSMPFDIDQWPVQAARSGSDGLKTDAQIVVRLCKALNCASEQGSQGGLSRHMMLRHFSAEEGSRAEATRASRFEQLQN